MSSDNEMTEPLLVTTTTIPTPRTRVWERQQRQGDNDENDRKNRITPHPSTNEELEESPIVVVMNGRHGGVSEQHEEEIEDSSALSSSTIDTEACERELSLVVLQILGEPYADNFGFWCHAVPASMALGVLVGLATLGFLAIVHSLMHAWFAASELPVQGQHVRYIVIGAAGGLVSGLVLLIPKAPPLGTARTMFHDAVQLGEHGGGLPTVALGILSSLTALASGAPLGPESAAGSIGSGMGLLVSRVMNGSRSHNNNNNTARRHFQAACVLCGMAASLGGLFPSPLLGILIVHELSIVGRPDRYSLHSVATTTTTTNTHDSDYMYQVFLSGTSATMAFVTIRLVAPHSFFPYNNNSNNSSSSLAQQDAFELWHLAAAVPLGIVCGLVGTVLLIVNGLCRSIRQASCRYFVRRGHPKWVGRLVFPTLAGITFGVVAYLNPLTAGTGMQFIQPLFKAALDQNDNKNNNLLPPPHALIGTALVKAMVMAVCLGFGLVGGPVFPLVYCGACLGLAFSQTLPISLAVPCCMAAMPGSFCAIPFTLVIFISLALRLESEQVGCVFVATIVSFTIVGGLGLVQKLGLKRLGETQQEQVGDAMTPSRRGLEHSLLVEEQQAGPLINDDDVLRSIRTAIFGE